MYRFTSINSVDKFLMWNRKLSRYPVVPKSVWPKTGFLYNNTYRDPLCSTRSTIPPFATPGNKHATQSIISLLSFRDVQVYLTLGQIECDSWNWASRPSRSNHSPYVVSPTICLMLAPEPSTVTLWTMRIKICWRVLYSDVMV